MSSNKDKEEYKRTESAQKGETPFITNCSAPPISSAQVMSGLENRNQKSTTNTKFISNFETTVSTFKKNVKPLRHNSKLG